MKNIFSFILLLAASTIFSQVGINTTTPSAAAVLEVSSSSNGTDFGGFMPPRLSISERDLIPLTADDEGLLVYVLDPPNSQLQIWDGSMWQTLFPQSIEFTANLASWEVNGIDDFGPSPFSPHSFSSAVAIGGLTRHEDLTISGTSGNNAWGANGWFYSGTDLPQEAVNAGSYITFTITPNTGRTLSIEVIEPYNIRRSGTGPTTGIWQYSTNGNDYFNIGSEINWGSVGSDGNLQSAINLSGIGALQNLDSSTTVTFRVVNWGATGDAGNWYINNTNGYDLVIRGTITQ